MIKKILFISICLLFLFACQDSQTKDQKNEQDYQWIGEINTKLVKKYSEKTNKLIYVYEGSGVGSATIDSDKDPRMSKNFLEIIEIIALDDPTTTTLIGKDKDNGNILVITNGFRNGSIEVQKSDVIPSKVD